jgi:hypothetical protein
MSLGSLFKQPWKLEVLDDPTQFVIGQFIPTEFEEGVSTNYAFQVGFGSENPVMQWVNGRLDTVSFTARLYAASIAESITSKLNTLKSFARKDPARRSPPPLLFTWGREIAKQCVLISLGGIRYDDIHIDGRIRGVALQIDLVEYREYQNAVESLGNGESFIHIAKDGDTFESIAAFHFARPDWGDLIRRRNPEFVALSPGDRVEVPEAWVLRTEKVEPQSIPFRRKTAQLANRALVFEARNYTYISHVV